MHINILTIPKSIIIFHPLPLSRSGGDTFEIQREGE